MKTVIYVLAVLISFNLVMTVIQSSSTVEVVESTMIYSKEEGLQEIAAKMEKLGVRFPYVVLAQLALESNFMRSKLCKEFNNCLGKKPSLGESIAADRTHAKFDSKGEFMLRWTEWMQEKMADYEQFRKPILTEEDYYEFLDCMCLPATPSRPWGDQTRCYRYAVDPNYTAKLRKIVKKLKTIQ